MRRTDREITDPGKISQIIAASHCCRLGFCDNGRVYIVPLSFGYEEAGGKRIFYFHSAREGRKLDLIRTCPQVGFELDTGYHLNTAREACGFSAGFQSIIGTGTVSMIEDEAQKRHALKCLMDHCAGPGDWYFPPAALAKVSVFKLEAEALSCKEHP